MRSNGPWRSNPFATRFVSPGNLEWIAVNDCSLAELAKRFQNQCLGNAAIVGPHGSGKSTLLAHLAPTLGQVRWRQSFDSLGQVSDLAGSIVWHGLRRGHQPFRQVVASRQYWSRGGLLILDGLEQLRIWEYAGLSCLLRATRMGLLATCHHPYRTLATLVSTKPRAETVQRLVAKHLTSDFGVTVALKEELCELQRIERWLVEEQGSVREVFMRMYDLVEDRKRLGVLSSTGDSRASLTESSKS